MLFELAKPGKHLWRPTQGAEKAHDSSTSGEALVLDLSVPIEE
jgi:hypothetical protein